MKKFKKLKHFFATLMLLIANVSFAQGFDDNVVDNPTVPIDNYVWMLLLIGSVYVFYKYKKLRSYEL